MTSFQKGKRNEKEEIPFIPSFFRYFISHFSSPFPLCNDVKWHIWLCRTKIIGREAPTKINKKNLDLVIYIFSSVEQYAILFGLRDLLYKRTDHNNVFFSSVIPLLYVSYLYANVFPLYFKTIYSSAIDVTTEED